MKKKLITGLFATSLIGSLVSVVPLLTSCVAGTITPQITQLSKNTYYEPNQSITINVTVLNLDEMPDAIVEWYLNSEKIADDDNNFQISNESITIKNTADLPEFSKLKYVLKNKNKEASTSTLLNCLNKFEINELSISTKAETQKDNIVLTNNSVEFDAKAMVNSKYENFIEYQWIDTKTQKIIGNGPKLLLSSNDFANNQNELELVCNAKIKVDTFESQVATSNKYNVFKIPSTQISTDYQITSTNSAQPILANTPIPAGNQISVNLNSSYNNQSINNDIKVEWFKNDQPLVSEQATQLIFDKITSNDSGTYKCNITYDYPLNDTTNWTFNESLKFDLNVVEPQKISIKNIENQEVINNQAWTLTLSPHLQNANVNTFTYQWFVKDNDNAEATPLPDYKNKATISLSASQVLQYNKKKFYCEIGVNNSFSQIKPIKTNEFTLNMINPTPSTNSPTIDINYQTTGTPLVGQSIILSPHELTFQAPNVQYNTIYKWQKSNDNSTWSDVTLDNNYSLSGNNLIIQNYQNDQTQYRFIAYPNNILEATIDQIKVTSQATTLKTPVNATISSATVVNSNNTIHVGGEESTALTVQNIQTNFQSLPENFKFQYSWYEVNNQKNVETLLMDYNDSPTFNYSTTEYIGQKQIKAKIRIIDANNKVFGNEFSTDATSLTIEPTFNVQLKDQYNAIKEQDLTITPINDYVNVGQYQPSYSWEMCQKDTSSWENVANENNTSLTLKNLTLNDSGKKYRLKVSYNDTSWTSNETMIQISEYPINVVADNYALSSQIGSKISLNVSVNSIENTNYTYSYQWYMVPKATSDQQPQAQIINNATNPTYTINDVDTNYDGAQFYCYVTNNEGYSQWNREPIIINVEKILFKNKPTLWFNCGGEYINASNFKFDPTIGASFKAKAASSTSAAKNIEPNYIIPNARFEYSWMLMDENSSEWKAFPDGENNNIIRIWKPEEGWEFFNNKWIKFCVKYKKGGKVYLSQECAPFQFVYNTKKVNIPATTIKSFRDGFLNINDKTITKLQQLLPKNSISLSSEASEIITKALECPDLKNNFKISIKYFRSDRGKVRFNCSITLMNGLLWDDQMSNQENEKIGDYYISGNELVMRNLETNLRALIIFSFTQWETVHKLIATWGPDKINSTNINENGVLNDKLKNEIIAAINQENGTVNNSEHNLYFPPEAVNRIVFIQNGYQGDKVNFQVGIVLNEGYFWWLQLSEIATDPEYGDRIDYKYPIQAVRLNGIVSNVTINKSSS